MIKAVIFDLDNTICNSSQVIRKVLEQSYQNFSNYFPHVSKDQFISVNDEGVKKLLDNPNVPVYSAEINIWYYILEQLNLTLSPVAIYKLYDDLLSDEVKNITAFRGLEKVLLFLKDRGIKIAILSNGSFVGKIRKIRKLKIDHFIDYLVSSDLSLADKPALSAFKYILKKMKLKPSETIYVGDQINIDINPAKKVGLKTILFMPDYKKYDEKELDKIEFKIRRYEEICSIFRKLGIR